MLPVTHEYYPLLRPDSRREQYRAHARLLFSRVQTDKIAEGRWFGLLPFALVIVVTWLGIKAVREEAKDKALSYGKGVGTGVLINLYAGVIGSIYGFIHFTYINPDFRDYMMNMTRQKWAEAGISDTQMDAMEKGMRFHDVADHVFHLGPDHDGVVWPGGRVGGSRVFSSGRRNPCSKTRSQPRKQRGRNPAVPASELTDLTYRRLSDCPDCPACAGSQLRHGHKRDHRAEAEKGENDVEVIDPFLTTAEEDRGCEHYGPLARVSSAYCRSSCLFLFQVNGSLRNRV